MSIFIALLFFSDAAHQTGAKFAVLIASVLSGMAGFMLLSVYNKNKIMSEFFGNTIEDSVTVIRYMLKG